MADGAVLGWLVLAYERATFLHMAGETSVGNTVALHQFWPSGTVRCMAIGAHHLALKDWVVRWLVGQYALLLVTGEADIRLGALVFYLVVGCV